MTRKAHNQFLIQNQQTLSRNFIQISSHLTNVDINKSLCKHDLDSSNHPKVASQGQSKWFDNCKICLPHYLIHSSRQYQIFSSKLQECVKKKLLKEIFLLKIKPVSFVTKERHVSAKYQLKNYKFYSFQLKISDFFFSFCSSKINIRFTFTLSIKL